jgi:hypothetical protein
MRRVEEFPHRTREIEHLSIPLPDGTKLAARLWLPETTERVPAIFELIPYRKRDMTAIRDTATHRFLAGHGYGCIRVDVRGTGESEGLYGNQFGGHYAEDAAAVIEWLARQPWCSGAVAMFGLSWGGAIALQVAARRPPALKAIVCAAGIDDRYALRYPGGCLATATVNGIVAQLSYATRPPDPALVGERWRDMWLARLEAARPLGAEWLGHPLRDDYWRAESIADDYARIACPVLLAAGWADPAFADAMLRTLAGLEAPRRAILGPWGHRYPHFGIPGPAIGYLQETLRWLDHWLKGSETGAMEEPQLRAFLPRGFGVAETPEARAGRWVGVSGWPPRASETLWLGAGLHAAPAAPATRSVPAGALVGACAGEPMPIFTTGPNPELPGDQRADDAASLCFDSPPLANAKELLGAPSVELAVTASAPCALVARLCEVAPDGRSRRIAWGARHIGLNDDFTGNAPAPGGREIRVRIRLNDVADTVSAGHRVRLALSTSYWPTLWTPSSSAAVAVRCEASRLGLPVAEALGAIAPLSAPEAAPGLRYREIRPGAYRRRTFADPATGGAVVEISDDMGEGVIEDIGMAIGEATTRRFRAPPAGAVETETRCVFARENWRAETLTRGVVRAKAGVFELDHALEARENGKVLFAREWRETVTPPDGTS